MTAINTGTKSLNTHLNALGSRIKSTQLEPAWISNNLPKLSNLSPNHDVVTTFGTLLTGKVAAFTSLAAGIDTAHSLATSHPILAGLTGLISLGAAGVTALADTQALRYVYRAVNRIA